MPPLGWRLSLQWSVLKKRILGLFFIHFLSFQTYNINFTTNNSEKMSIQSLELGFELATFWLWISSTRQGLPPSPQIVLAWFSFKQFFFFFLYLDNRLSCDLKANEGYRCVNTNQCEEGIIITDGRGQLDVRTGSPLDGSNFKCNDKSQVCCLQPGFTQPGIYLFIFVSRGIKSNNP